MNISLIRMHYSKDGIFSKLICEDVTFFTCEHAFMTEKETYRPKLPPGIYKCVRGEHQLEHMTKPFITFEITGVVGHTNILFHVGNKQNDSDGCVLVGKSMSFGSVPPMVLQSREAFARFMSLQEGCDEFELTVE